MLDRRQRRIDQQQFDLLGLDLIGQGRHMAGAQIGGGPDFAHLDHLRKDDVETDGPGQAFELGLPRFDAVIG
ncbi:hypothetical protein D3C86_2007700 [compost metagenome]